MPSPSSLVAPSYRRLLADNPRFRRLWLGEVVSLFGDWFNTIALFEIVGQLTDSALALGGVLIAKSLPAFLVTPIAGPLADRVERRGLMIATDVARAVLVGALLAAWWWGSLPLLYGALSLMVACTGIFMPARGAVLPEITTDEELPAAVALDGGTWSVMLAMGAAAGGVVTELIGVEGALLLDAVTFVVSAVLLAGLPPLPPPPPDAAVPTTRFVDGVRYLARTPHVALLTGTKAVMGVTSAQLVMLPLYGDGVFPLAGPLWIGLLSAARGVGAGTASLGLRAWVGDAPGTLRAGILGGFVLLAVGILGVAASPSIGWAALAFGVGAFGNATIWVFSSTLVLTTAERSVRGRVTSIELGALTLTMAILSAWGGWAVDHGWAPGEVMVASAVAGLVCGIPWAIAIVRSAPPAPAPAS